MSQSCSSRMSQKGTLVLDKDSAFNEEDSDDLITDKFWADLFKYEYISQSTGSTHAQQIIYEAYIHPYVLGGLVDLKCTCKSDDDGPKCAENCFNRGNNIFCSESCGENCTNQRYETKDAWKHFKVVPVAGRGLCLLSKLPFKKGQVLFEYAGEVKVGVPCPGDKFACKITGQKFVGENQIYMSTLKKANFCRMVQHSTSPNSYMETWLYDGQLVLIVKALQNIQTGDVITLRFDHLINN